MAWPIHILYNTTPLVKLFRAAILSIVAACRRTVEWGTEVLQKITYLMSQNCRQAMIAIPAFTDKLYPQVRGIPTVLTKCGGVTPHTHYWNTPLVHNVNCLDY